jgi:hypothetical protein
VPSTSPKQRRTMAAAAHDPAFAKHMGIPQSVAREFYAADQRKARRDSIVRAFARAKATKEAA